MELDVTRLGRGPRVVFVHGSVVGADLTFRRQHELADRFTLVFPNRPGFGASPPLERGDFEAEAPLFAEQLGDGAHLVGHSYGGVIAMFAAAQRPDAVRSLTLSEPGLLRFCANRAEVAEMIANGERLYANPESIPTEVFLRLFRSGAGSSHETPEELPDYLASGAEMVKRERPPWEAEIPLEDLAAAGFPVLIVSGGHSRAFDIVCDALAERLGAERAVIPGRGHTIPGTGAPYNERLAGFLTETEQRRSAGGYRAR